MEHAVNDPIKSKIVEKQFGKGSIGIIGCDVMAVLTPMRVNGVPDCICLRLGDLHDFETDPHDVAKTVETFAENCVHGNLTPAMCHITPFRAWQHAADLLEALAKAARERSKKLLPRVRAKRKATA